MSDMEQIKSIVGKWNGNAVRPGYMIKFKDGNTRNCMPMNLEYITFKDVFAKKPTEQRVYVFFSVPNLHISSIDLKVILTLRSNYSDWDCYLTKEEIRFVLTHWNDFRALFGGTSK